MKKIEVSLYRTLYLCALVCLVTVLLLPVGVPSAHAGAKLKIDPLHFDCGEVPEGSPAGMVAVLENEGDAALVIKNVRTN